MTRPVDAVSRPGVEVHVGIRLDLAGLASWPADRSAALLRGVGKVIAACPAEPVEDFKRRRGEFGTTAERLPLSDLPAEAGEFTTTGAGTAEDFKRQRGMGGTSIHGGSG